VTLRKSAVRVLLCAGVILLSWLWTGSVYREGRNGFYADEASYFAIAQSLAHDGDLKYTRDDILRIRRDFPDGPQGIFLKKTPRGDLAFAKSYAYPLLGAPFVALWGKDGLLVCNALMLLAILAMGLVWLGRFQPERQAFATIFLFVFGTVMPLYTVWMTADLFNAFCVWGGLFFFLFPFRRKAWFFFHVPFVALAIFSKLTPILIFLPLYGLLLLGRRWRAFLAGGVALMLCGVLLTGFLKLQTGSVNFQGGERRTFYHHFPFETPQDTFESGYRMSTDNYWDRFYLSPQTAQHNLLYLLAGRHTGMMLYAFPAFLGLLLFLLRGPGRTREEWALLLGGGAATLAFILLAPDNYFGGSGSLGNRYFLPIVPVLFFLGWFRPHTRQARYLLNGMMGASAGLLMLPLFLGNLPRPQPAQWAGFSPPFRFFPAEMTQINSLPTNENPAAWRRPLDQLDPPLWLYFTGDGQWAMEDSFFWTRGTGDSEVMLLSTEPMPSLRVSVQAGPKAVSVRFCADGGVWQRDVLEPGASVVFEEKRPWGLKVDQNRFLYRFHVGGDRGFMPAWEQAGATDRRNLGVKVQVLREKS